MPYSSAQLIAVSGLTQGTGLQISGKLTAAIATAQSTTTLTGRLRSIVLSQDPAGSAILTTLRTKVPGFSLTAPVSYTSLPATILTTDITKSIQNRSAIFFQRGPQGFLGILTRASGVCQTSRSTLGALHGVQLNGFEGIAPDITSHTDIATGGITSKFGPLALGSTAYIKASTLYTGTAAVKVTAADVQNSISSVADAILSLGTLYDFKELAVLGTPQGLVKNLYKQGLLNASFVALLASEGITINKIEAANTQLLTGALSSITGTDLDKIITATNLQLPSATSVNNGSDLLDATKLFLPAALDAIPGASLIALGQQLVSLNLTFNNTSDLAKALKAIAIPNTPKLNALTQPVPDKDIAVIKSSTPNGTGEFGSPLIQELIGTPAGFVHTDALTEINILSQTTSSQATTVLLIAAADDLIAKYAAKAAAKAAYDAEPALTKATKLAAVTTATADAVTSETAFSTALNNFTNASANSGAISATNTAIVSIIEQIRTELTNCTLAGVDIYATQPGTSFTLTTTQQFPTFGIDAGKIGITSMLQNMTTPDIYGEAIQSILVQGQNEDTLKSVGGKSVGTPDISQVTKLYRAQSGGGLSAQQQENVINYAQSNALDITQALTNAALYGYDNNFYTSKGYPAA